MSCFNCPVALKHLQLATISKLTHPHNSASVVRVGELGNLLCKQAALSYFEYVAVNRDAHVRLH